MAVVRAMRQETAVAPDSWTPPYIQPPVELPGRLRMMAQFIRNPLLVVPDAVYTQEFVQVSTNPPVAWISSPDLIKSVLLDQRETFKKLSQIRLLSPLLGKGILTSEDADWRWQRQTAAPMFRHQELMRFVPTFAQATERMIARWRAAGPGTVHDVDRDMTLATFDVISQTLLPSADKTLGPIVERSAGRFQSGGAWSQLYAFLRVPSWVPNPGRVSMGIARVVLRGSVRRMIADRRAEPRPPDDLMNRLMQAVAPDTGRPMTDEQLIDNLLTFYLAGHETTARALTWTLYVLSRAPDWAGALREEIRSVAGDAPITADHVDKLTLTQQVLKESMRLFPPVPMMSRQAVADTSLAGRPIKAGTSIAISIYALHRHRALWEAPNVFAPGRFAPDKEAALSRYQYMPFGAGPRICIGMSFAMIEATTMLATMLRAATFTPSGTEEPVPIARVTLSPKGGLPLRIAVHERLGRGVGAG